MQKVLAGWGEASGCAKSYYIIQPNMPTQPLRCSTRVIVPRWVSKLWARTHTDMCMRAWHAVGSYWAVNCGAQETIARSTGHFLLFLALPGSSSGAAAAFLSSVDVPAIATAPEGNVRMSGSDRGPPQVSPPTPCSNAIHKSRWKTTRSARHVNILVGIQQCREQLSTSAKSQPERLH